ncbi:DUF2867 domain-containing protein, partial [Pseudophaeobacter sp.]|uniref:DUF2867 domain-containing protein n=1 Tax=Pseudophaeobacter sp. TaxID=1971739 RepID=UPI002622EB98
MKHFGIKKVTVALPSAFLEGVNWADAYEFSPVSEQFDALEAARVMFEKDPPLWVRCLNGTRNRIVGLFGIKPGQISIDEKTGGAFPLLSRSEDVVVYGFDDWHLNFRVVIQIHDVNSGRAVRLTTLVRRKNGFGYGYIFLITPF